MIKVNKPNTVPASLQDCDEKIKDALINKNKHNFRGYAQDDVKQELSKIYNNKCAFCETDTTAGSVLQVEHYRPKAKVTEEPAHKGYYWLAYEWTNLLYACASCNRAKANFFPLHINGIRVFQPVLNAGILDKASCKFDSSILLNEKPLLLNPEAKDFKPEKHIILGPNGNIVSVSPQGKTTIEKCKLHRPSLIIARKGIVDKHLQNFFKAFEKKRNGIISQDNLIGRIQVEIEQMLDRIIENQPYTLLAKTMLKYFHKFFTERFQPEEQAILKAVYNQFTNEIRSIQ
jgi:hypothetical protein